MTERETIEFMERVKSLDEIQRAKFYEYLKELCKECEGICQK